MTGVLNIGECVEGFKEKNVTSFFYRLEKLDYILPDKQEHPFYDVYEFYTVQNGFKYYRHHEEPVYNGKRQLGHIYKDVRLGYTDKAKEEGNRKYKKLKELGYKFVGIYECDICGYSRRIK